MPEEDVMTSYLVTYHGGGMPETEEGRQQALAAFGAWVGKVGDALADPGAPLGAAMTVSAAGVQPGAADGPVAGYSVLRADDIELLRCLAHCDTLLRFELTGGGHNCACLRQEWRRSRTYHNRL